MIIYILTAVMVLQEKNTVVVDTKAFKSAVVCLEEAELFKEKNKDKSPVTDCKKTVVVEKRD